MSIERLGFTNDNDYNALELSIHLARYSIAEKICPNLDVLDVACGEGYGSYIMANYWQAKSVKAVDISVEAIEVAQANLSSQNIEYFCHNAEEIDSLFPPNSFDLVISLETVEHVKNPEKFLAAIHQVLKPDGIAIISCPNDHWYYGPGKSGNPYHLHTYYFDEFKAVAEKILGNASCYLLGTPLYGFGNFLLSDVANTGKKMMSGLLSLQSVNCNRINTQESICVDNCAYFVGIWGNIAELDKIASSIIYPSSMDTYRVPTTTLHEIYSRLNCLENSLKTHEKWSENLQAGKDWLEAQYIFWMQKAENQKLWVDELQTSKDWLETQYIFWMQKAEQIQIELEQAKYRVQQIQIELEQAKLSKSWNLRTQWLKLKNFFGLSQSK